MNKVSCRGWHLNANITSACSCLRLWGGPARPERDKTHFLFLARKLRERAEEALTLADDFRDPEARRMILEIAERYKRLAQRIENE